MAFFDQNTLAQLDAGYTPAAQKPKKKGPRGVEGFLVNNLPGIVGGVGSLVGSVAAPGVGTVAGGAGGGALGEVLKRRILGESLDPKEIAIQGAEGGLLSGGLKSASTAIKGLAGGAKVAAQTAEKQTAGDIGKSFLNNMTTQGQQMQARGLGISGGAKVAGKELAPQDTERMLQTLKDEGIKIGNANSTARDVNTKLGDYGQQIAEHFKVNNAPLHAEDTKVIADNFLNGIKTTDPGVLKQADILAQDLQKNVKDTKSLWEFRKTLDSRIPDSKFMDAATTNKVAALKEMRDYVSKELGDVPAMQNYHALSEIKPFLGKGMREVNQPSGGIAGRVLSSGPIQQLEAVAGKGVEKVGQMGSKTLPEATQAAESAPKGFMSKLTTAATAPLANPTGTAGKVIKQEAGRGFGIPAELAQNNTGQSDSTQQPDISSSILQASTQDQNTSNDPFSPENVQANVQAILQQGGKMKDVSEYLANVEAYQKLTSSGGKPLNATQQQQANNANSGLQDIQNLSDMLAKDPSLAIKSSLPGGSITQRLTGSTDYAAARNNIVDVISRLRSGAAITAGEEKLYKSLLPAAGDTSDSAKSKLQRLSNLLSSFANPQGSSGSDVTDLLANAGA